MKKSIFDIFKPTSETLENEDSQTETLVANEALQQQPISVEGATLAANLEEDDDPDAPDLITDEMVEFCKTQLESILSMSGFNSLVTSEKGGKRLIKVRMDDEADISRLIGREGNNLESLQILIKAMAIKKFGVSIQIAMDAGDYRERRMEKIQSQALRIASYISDTNTKEELNTMNASERRIIHMIFKDHSSIKTYSVGEGRNRRIVLEKK
ncbi:hypothetical protein HOH87_05195 [bacterium]|jgi:spoIIIJ-associated protein|nr:hypothetical protein [bacterium]